MFTVLSHKASDILDLVNQPEGRRYYDLFDARTVAEIELRARMTEHPDTRLDISGTKEGTTLYVLNNGVVWHIYILSEDGGMMPLRIPSLPFDYWERIEDGVSWITLDQKREALGDFNFRTDVR